MTTKYIKEVICITKNKYSIHFCDFNVLIKNLIKINTNISFIFGYFLTNQCQNIFTLWYLKIKGQTIMQWRYGYD